MFKKIALASGAAAILMGSTAYASVIDRPFFQVLGVVVVWGGDTAGQDATANPVVSDFVLLTTGTGNEGADLIGADGYSIVTGSLDPISGATATPANGGDFDDTTGTSTGVLDANDTLTAFGIDQTTDVDGLAGTHESSFYVASNAAFDINADATLLQNTAGFSTMGLDNIAFSMTADIDDTDGLGGLNYGTAAQLPTASGGFQSATVADLGDITTSTKVFAVDQKTASTVGSIADQSIRINSTYELDADTGTAGVQGYDLSMGVGTLEAEVTYTVYVP